MQIWECIITRKVQVTRPNPTFYDYTDWFSDISGRLNPDFWGDFIMTVTQIPICTVEGENIEELKSS